MVPANMISLSEEDIAKVISSFQGQQKEVLLWQRDDQGIKRNIQRARIARVNKEKDEIVIDPETLFTATKNKPLYVFDQRRQIVFKAQITDLQPKKMILKFPISLILPNERLEERINYLEQKIFLHFTLHPDVKQTEIKDLHKAQLIDVSANGISFKSSLEKDFGLQQGDRIWIKLDQDDELTEGVVKHLSLMKPSTHEHYIQIGIKFQTDGF